MGYEPSGSKTLESSSVAAQLVASRVAISSIIYIRRNHDISTCTREVPGSSLGRDIDNIHWDFS
jgi:hypothetical protein